MMDKRQIRVKVHCGWHGENSLLRQTPKLDGVWGNVKFFFDEKTTQNIKDFDYLMVFNWPLEKLEVRCYPGNKWLVSGEPPINYNKFAIPTYKQFDKIFTQHSKNLIKDHIKIDPKVPWIIKKTYNELISLPKNDQNKIDKVSCITSNLTWKPGHADRINLLKEFDKSGFKVETYGRGIRPMPNDDKFEILYPYKYSIAIENSYYDHYWTEKIADCFLSWTMPIYSGAPNIFEYFPKESMIIINAKKPKESLKIIKEAIANKSWEKNIDAIEEARNLILNKYQFFPYFVEQINTQEAKKVKEKQMQDYVIQKVVPPWHQDYKPTFFRKLEYRFRRLFDIKPY
ncbi:MAG: glycosyltransferase family 10 [Saprospiraceae bacterium]|nr:glycosyltransferase family 10 [Saprospiraceae bacterium]